MHVLFNISWINLWFWQVVPHGRWRGNCLQRSFALWPFARHLPIHRQRAPHPDGGRGTLLAGLQELNGRLRGQALVVVVVHLDHGGVGTGPQALHLPQGEEPVLSRLSFLDGEVVLDGLLDFLRPADHAGRGAAQLQEVLPRLLPVKHGVERRDLVHSHGSDTHHLRHLVHSGQGQPSTTLSLSQVQKRHYSTLLEVLRILSKNLIDHFVVFICEIEIGFWVVIRSIPMLRCQVASTQKWSGMQSTNSNPIVHCISDGLEPSHSLQECHVLRISYADFFSNRD
mmetsp:Transcript_12938/g.19099  ORF Transcript_12938/g.19099 Transcript_12938/m.19099 type:complete len:283 (+) Transcript_12938:225-1073(+)